MGMLLCIFYVLSSMNFNKFYSISTWRESFLKYEKERESDGTGIFDIIPLSLSFKYEAFKSNSESWSSYYFVSVSLFSPQYLYFPIVYNSYLKLKKTESEFAEKLMRLKMAEDYIKIWCYAHEINNIDSLITIYRKKLSGYKSDSERGLYILKTEKRMQDLMFARTNLLKKYKFLLKKHGLEDTLFYTIEEDLLDILGIIHRVLNSQKDFDTLIIIKKLHYLQQKKIYSLLKIGPTLDYITASQFLSLTPTDKLRSNTIKGLTISIQFSPLEALRSIKVYNKKIRQLKYEHRRKVIKKIDGNDDLNLLNLRVRFLNKLENYYVQTERLYAKGVIDIITFSESADFYYSTYNDILEEIIQIMERSLVYETN